MTRKIDKCDMWVFGALGNGEKTIAVLVDRWWPQTAKQEGDKTSKKFLCNIWVSQLGVGTVLGTVLRLERGALSMVKRLRQATNEYALPPPSDVLHPGIIGMRGSMSYDGGHAWR